MLDTACRRRSLTYQTIDIDQIPGFRGYGEEIPVLLVGGRKVLKHHFPEQRLGRILDRRVRSRPDNS